MPFTLTPIENFTLWPKEQKVVIDDRKKVRINKQQLLVPGKNDRKTYCSNNANLNLRETEFDDPLKLASPLLLLAPAPPPNPLTKSFAGDIFDPTARIRVPVRRRFHMHEQHR
ncbi:hypothetical protein NL676_005600 [Syzygium grande]|nr:hypothetical protein NL676_005600 [Syzygium grande]